MSPSQSWWFTKTNELRPATISTRVRGVANAMGIPLDDLGDTLRFESLRGRLASINTIELYFRELEPLGLSLIVLDAVYRFYPENMRENENAQMTQIFNALDRHASRLSTGFVGIHHASKGDQSQKHVTDVGAGAGSQSRAVDSHIILRPHAR